MSEPGSGKTPTPGRRSEPDSERGMESVRRASSLPSGVFRAASPTVERALAADVGDIFIRHMSRTDRVGAAEEAPRQHRPDPGIEARNKVSDEELDALVTALRHRIKVSAPRVDDQLGAERTWILLDLSLVAGRELRRQALRELRSTLERRHGIDTVLAASEGLLHRLEAGELEVTGISRSAIEEFGQAIAALRNERGPIG